MRSKHLFFSLCVVVALTIFMASQTFAAGGGGGGAEGLPEGAVVVGPAVWATVVLTCSGDVVEMISMRAKKIEDCNVETEAMLFNLLGTTIQLDCPLSADDVVNNYLPGLYIFGTIDPVITKVKNFVINHRVTGTISFDAQIKYLQP